MNLQLAIIYEMGDPNVYGLINHDYGKKEIYYDSQNIKGPEYSQEAQVYFSIDDESFPYKASKAGVVDILV